VHGREPDVFSEWDEGDGVPLRRRCLGWCLCVRRGAGS